ncbi:hypothetical protein CP556_21485 [Natrinema sp. CBA1119]|uniref:hypothetical protein n=1 Tax=Natrinema sp. CBA1119 TaxID=1608465 RepID=UPI000BF496AD|nr:hypothetical protein [Natrinema sp. CBA1119]PGF14334.1 hypothetical protein CP556_21740 [Natrinema sp. CBA1119]PGF14434.1 hypothetical protein CP556_21485 [Natrinema sp. CBA1119]
MYKNVNKGELSIGGIGIENLLDLTQQVIDYVGRAGQALLMGVAIAIYRAFPEGALKLKAVLKPELATIAAKPLPAETEIE